MRLMVLLGGVGLLDVPAAVSSADLDENNFPASSGKATAIWCPTQPSDPNYLFYCRASFLGGAFPTDAVPVV